MTDESCLYCNREGECEKGLPGLLCQLSEEEKKLPVIQKLVGFFGRLDKTAEDGTHVTRLIVTLEDIESQRIADCAGIDV